MARYTERLHDAVYETLRVLETNELVATEAQIASAVSLAEDLLERVNALTGRERSQEAKTPPPGGEATRMVRSEAPSRSG